MGLEVLPRKRVEHRGRVLEEFDLEAALKRRPAMLLVDELAHTNAAGCRHPSAGRTSRNCSSRASTCSRR
jgi:two-component system sensor histidine kinase KdpD